MLEGRISWWVFPSPFPILPKYEVLSFQGQRQGQTGLWASVLWGSWPWVLESVGPGSYPDSEQMSHVSCASGSPLQSEDDGTCFTDGCKNKWIVRKTVTTQYKNTTRPLLGFQASLPWNNSEECLIQVSQVGFLLTGFYWPLRVGEWVGSSEGSWSNHLHGNSKCFVPGMAWSSSVGRVATGGRVVVLGLSWLGIANPDTLVAGGNEGQTYETVHLKCSGGYEKSVNLDYSLWMELRKSLKPFIHLGSQGCIHFLPTALL